MPSKKRTKKQIKKAADEIPDLIAHNMRREEQVDNVLRHIYGDRGQRKIHIPSTAETKRKTLWGGVIGVALVIFIMWIWNVSTMVHDVMAIKNIQPAPWAEAQNEFSYIMGTIKNQEVETLDTVFQNGMKEEEEKEALRNTMDILAQRVWNEAQHASSSTTSTPISIDSATSTPTISTSTTSTVSE
ncbi:MAG: hypothetical protein ABII02_03135 [Candidatus Magasanikbacteria bacterium]